MSSLNGAAGTQNRGQSVRTLRHGEEPELLRLLAQTHGNFHDSPETKRVLSSQRFDPAGCFVLDENGSLGGCVAVTRLPRAKWFVIRYLAVRNARSKVEAAEKLLERAVQYARSENAEFLRATTPAIEPYVTVYKSAGFRPVRRDFRISWYLDATENPERNDLKIRQLEHSELDEAAGPYAESLRPYWDWRTEEHGGTAAVSSSFTEDVRKGERWLVCSVENRMVWFVGLLSDFYDSGKARFRGASVVPEFRGRRIGLALMQEIIIFAKKLGQHRMTVYTFSYLDCLAPGAMLYLRSGGKIEAEYLQLQM